MVHRPFAPPIRAHSTDSNGYIRNATALMVFRRRPLTATVPILASPARPVPRGNVPGIIATRKPALDRKPQGIATPAGAIRGDGDSPAWQESAHGQEDHRQDAEKEGDRGFGKFNMENDVQDDER